MYGNDGGIDVIVRRRREVGSDPHRRARASPITRRPTCAIRTTSAPVCRTTARGADRARCATNGGIRQWMWISVGGGDGFQNQIDPTDFNIFYTESQNAGISRYDLTTGESRKHQAERSAAAEAVAAVAAAAAAAAEPGGEGDRSSGAGGGRGNIINPIPARRSSSTGTTPIRLSPHNPSTLLLGGRSLFISRDRGNTWTMTKELGQGRSTSTRARSWACRTRSRAAAVAAAAPGVACILSKNDGYVANEFGTMTELAESPIVPGVLWAGTDDGNIQVSRDGGYTWEEVGKNIPGVNHEYYVSGLEASWYDAGTAYVALDGHRNDDLKPYIFKTTDYGKTWTSVSGNLPAVGNVNSIRQDPVNRNLLYAPTELGFYVSLDDGKNWHRFMPNLPIGRVDEVIVHPRDNDLILATHSRSVWIMDDVSRAPAADAGRRSTSSRRCSRRATPCSGRTIAASATAMPGDKWWAGENAPRGTAIAYYLKNGGGDAKITISDAVTGREFRTHDGTEQPRGSTAGSGICAARRQPQAQAVARWPRRWWRWWRWRRMSRAAAGSRRSAPTA